MNSDIVAHLLDEMEEYYGAFDHYPLYLLGWELNDGVRTPDQKHALAQRAYDQFTARHRVRLVWTRWPIDLDAAWPADGATTVEFDADPDAPVETPMLVLVPVE